MTAKPDQSNTPAYRAEIERWAKQWLVKFDENEYDITDQVACGGHAAVYKATQVFGDGDSTREVAIKIINVAYVQGSEIITEQHTKHFIEEINMMDGVDSAYVPPIYGHGTTIDNNNHPTPWFAMKYIDESQKLDDFLESQSLSHYEYVEIFQQIFKGTAAIHDAKTHHGDINARNVLIGDDPDRPNKHKPWIIDFGIARSPDKNLGHGPDQFDRSDDVKQIGTMFLDLRKGRDDDEWDTMLETVIKAAIDSNPQLSARALADHLGCWLEVDKRLRSQLKSKRQTIPDSIETLRTEAFNRGGLAKRFRWDEFQLLLYRDVPAWSLVISSKVLIDNNRPDEVDDEALYDLRGKCMDQMNLSKRETPLVVVDLFVRCTECICALFIRRSESLDSAEDRSESLDSAEDLLRHTIGVAQDAVDLPRDASEIVRSTMFVSRLHFLLGITLWKQHKWTQAEEVFSALFDTDELDPTMRSQTLGFLSKCQAEMGRTVDAVRTSSKAVDDCEYDAGHMVHAAVTAAVVQSRLSQGTSLLGQGEYEQAEEVFSALLDTDELDPVNQAIAALFLSDCQNRTGRNLDAIKTISNAIEAFDDCQLESDPKAKAQYHYLLESRQWLLSKGDNLG